MSNQNGATGRPVHVVSDPCPTMTDSPAGIVANYFRMADREFFRFNGHQLTVNTEPFLVKWTLEKKRTNLPKSAG